MPAYTPSGGSAAALSSQSPSVESVDPDGLDPTLRNQVLIGHSQGELLAKLLIVDAGQRFWELVVEEIRRILTEHLGDTIFYDKTARRKALAPQPLMSDSPSRG